MPLIYLDNAATTPVDPRVREAMLPFLGGIGEEFGNPSSRHRLGQRAAEAVEEARRSVARAVGAKAAHLHFASGGTEANNLGVLGAARARAKHGRHVLVGPTEHPCVRESAEALRAEGFEVEEGHLARDGSLDLDHLAACLREDTVLVAQMLAQNEVGSVYPLREVARIVRARAPRAALHVDAVQALGKVEISLAELGADTLAVSSHKVHGPKGVGALACAGSAPLRPLTFGGGQQGGIRPGTENVPGIVGFGVAARLADELREEAVASMSRARDVLVAAIECIPGARVLRPGAPSQPTLPAVVAAILPGAPSEVRMHHLEELGVVVSAGSACHSRKSDVSPALRALGLSPEEARCMLRFSFSRDTTLEEARAAAQALEVVCRKLARARR